MDQTVTPDPASIEFTTNLGPAVGYNFAWASPTCLLCDANDIGGAPEWVNVELLNEDAGVRSALEVNCCPFGPTALVED